MDGIFVPESRESHYGQEAEHQARAQRLDSGFRTRGEEPSEREAYEASRAGGDRTVGTGGPLGVRKRENKAASDFDAPAPSEDVPMIFRQPTVQEVQDVLEQEGLPAYVAVASGDFCAKKLCLSGAYLYILEPDSSVPAVFLGMSGFCLEDLRRVVLGQMPAEKPLLSLEFQGGFLPVRLGSPTVLRGLVGALCHGREVQIVQQDGWSA
ncbi:unnamed protein product [Effrenium voratum]|nr:unnamed protein product [Effrenium voratum]